MKFERWLAQGLIGEEVEIKGARLEIIGVTEREVTLRLLSFSDGERPTNADLTQELERVFSERSLLA